MNFIISKERRSLRPSFLATVAVTILCAMIFNGSDASGVVIGFYGAGAVLMAASIFGNEFHSRTMLLLLSQPVPRRQLWNDKMRELALELFVSFIVLVLSLAFLVRGEGRIGAHSDLAAFLEILSLVFIPLTAFCSAPFLSLQVKNVLGAMAFTFVLPYALVLCFMGIDWALTLLAGHEQLFLEELSLKSPPVFWGLVCLATIAYCLAFYQMGYHAFLEFQEIDSRSRELALPAIAERWAASLTPGYTGPFVSLFRKELRLHQVSFLVAGFSVIVAPILAVACKIHPSEVAMGILGLPFFLCFFCIPFLTGLVTLAEEKNMGIIGWQLTQPVSPLKQWFAKMLVAFGTCIVLGLALPGLMLFFGHELFGFWKDAQFNENQLVVSSLIYIGFFSLVVFGSTISNNVSRAAASAFGVLIACVAASALGMNAYRWIADYLSTSPNPVLHSPDVVFIRFLLVSEIALVNWFSYYNFRNPELPTRRIWTQLIVITIYTGLVLILMALLDGALIRYF